MTPDQVGSLVAAGLTVALIAGLAAGALLHELHVAGHPARRVSSLRMVFYVSVIGLLYQIGQSITAAIFGFDAILVFARVIGWVVFSIGAGISVAILDRRRQAKAAREARNGSNQK